jgi:hypothetical protein
MSATKLKIVAVPDEVQDNAREGEAQITPEMIEAGLTEFSAFDSRFEHDYRELVISIYEAMELARVVGHPAGEAANGRPLLRPEF